MESYKPKKKKEIYLVDKVNNYKTTHFFQTIKDSKIIPNNNLKVYGNNINNEVLINNTLYKNNQYRTEKENNIKKPNSAFYTTNDIRENIYQFDHLVEKRLEGIDFEQDDSINIISQNSKLPIPKVLINNENSSEVLINKRYLDNITIFDHNKKIYKAPSYKE